MTPKDFIEELKDYADIADASYAMLHYIDENEVLDANLDTMKANNPNPNIKPPARWIYADGIKLGYEVETLTEIAEKNNRQVGQPTAYALAIEARFSQNIKILKPSENGFVKIDNKIQNFINRKKEDLNVADSDKTIYLKSLIARMSSEIIVERRKNVAQPQQEIINLPK